MITHESQPQALPADTAVEQLPLEVLSDHYDTLALHAIRSYGNLGPFRAVDKEKFTGMRLFEILLREEQILACSTIRSGDGPENLYGTWGVVVSRGTIVQACPYDAVSSVRAGELVSKFAPRLADIPLTEQLAQALATRHTYNELSVAVSGISGVFYSLANDKTLVEPPSLVAQDLIAWYGIPEYALYRGQLYAIEGLTDTFRNGPEAELGNALSAADCTAGHVTLDAGQRDELLEFLCRNLTLSPRNVISSGVDRGTFAYQYRQQTGEASATFFAEQRKLIGRENDPSLRLYGAMALHAFAEAAKGYNDTVQAVHAQALAATVLSCDEYMLRKRRIVANGHLSITPLELQYYLAHDDLPEHLRNH